jgi:hypothetical protein
MPAACEARLHVNAHMWICLLNLTWNHAFSDRTTQSCLGRALCEVIAVDIRVTGSCSEPGGSHGAVGAGVGQQVKPGMCKAGGGWVGGEYI